MVDRSSGLTVSICAAVLVFAQVAHAGPILGDTFEKAYPVDPNSTIHIRNTDGSISVYGGTANEMKIEAIKRSFSAERLAAISVSVSIKPGEVSVDTIYPPQPKWGLHDRSGTVDYYITVPWNCRELRIELATGEIFLEELRCGLTDAKLRSGRISINNCFTNLHASVSTGAFDANWDWWERQKFGLDIEVAGGNAKVRVPESAAFHLLATCIHGNIDSDLLEIGNRNDDEIPRIDVPLGGASETEIRLKATDGNISVLNAAP